MIGNDFVREKVNGKRSVGGIPFINRYADAGASWKMRAFKLNSARKYLFSSTAADESLNSVSHSILRILLIPRNAVCHRPLLQLNNVLIDSRAFHVPG